MHGSFSSIPCFESTTKTSFSMNDKHSSRPMQYDFSRQTISFYEKPKVFIVQHFTKSIVRQVDPDEYANKYQTVLLDPETLIKIARRLNINEQMVRSVSPFSSKEKLTRSFSFYDATSSWCRQDSSTITDDSSSGLELFLDNGRFSFYFFTNTNLTKTDSRRILKISSESNSTQRRTNLFAVFIVESHLSVRHSEIVSREGPALLE